MDRYLLVALKFVRMVAYGLTTMILVPFLLSVGCLDAEVGLFMTLTLIGDVLLSFAVTFKADRIGRRFMLGLSSVLMLLSGVCFMFCTNFWLLLIAAVIGVISPSGDEVGPFRSIEESAVAQLCEGGSRARLFAAQNLVGTFGMAFGMVAGGYISDWFTDRTGRAIDAYRVVFFGYVMCALVSLVISARLSIRVEVSRNFTSSAADLVTATDPNEQNNTEDTTLSAQGAEESGVTAASPLLPSSSAALATTKLGTSLSLIALFGIDSLAYGFMTNSWLVEYIYRTFSASSTVTGWFFFVAASISALTSFPSAWLTNRVGSVNAICWTKIGAGFFGALIPLAYRLWEAMVFIWLRSVFDTMDVVPRQMFLTSVIAEQDRTRVLGLINISKTIGRSIGPIFTGILAQCNLIVWCFPIMGGLEWLFAMAVYYRFK